MDYLEEIDFRRSDFGELHDELPLWSAPFGLRMLEHVPIRGGQTVLDVGAGTGFLTLELAQRCGPRSKIIAVDPWTAGMARLRRKLENLDLDNVTLLEQDASTLDLPNESVDVIVSNLGINNFDDVEAVLRTLLRVAKPGSRLILTTNLQGHMAEFYEVLRSTLIELGQQDRLPVLDRHVEHRGTVDSIATMLRNAGFAIVETETDSFRMRFADGTSLLRHYLIRLGFIQEWKSIPNPEMINATFDRLEDSLNALATRQGEVTLTVPIACIQATKP